MSPFQREAINLFMLFKQQTHTKTTTGPRANTAPLTGGSWRGWGHRFHALPVPALRRQRASGGPRIQQAWPQRTFLGGAWSLQRLLPLVRLRAAHTHPESAQLRVGTGHTRTRGHTRKQQGKACRIARPAADSTTSSRAGRSHRRRAWWQRCCRPEHAGRDDGLAVAHGFEEGRRRHPPSGRTGRGAWARAEEGAGGGSSA